MMMMSFGELLHLVSGLRIVDSINVFTDTTHTHTQTLNDISFPLIIYLVCDDFKMDSSTSLS